MKKYLRIDYYVPVSHLEKTKEALFAAGAGKFGSYDYCSWETLGRGQFRPLKGSSPCIGQEFTLEQLDEYKVEMIFPAEIKSAVIAALKLSHPYELPSYQIIDLVIE